MLGLAFQEARRGEQLGLHLAQDKTKKRTRRRRRPKNPTTTAKDGPDSPLQTQDLYLVIRCGMVRVMNAEKVLTSTVGRVTILNWDAQVMFDALVKIAPSMRIIDYQTHLSGVTKASLVQAKLTFEQIRSKVGNLIKGKIVIGHGLEVDLSALGLSHPWSDVRDAATWQGYQTEATSVDASDNNDGETTTTSTMKLPKDLYQLIQEFLPHRAQRMPPHVPDSPMQLKPIYEAQCILELYKLARLDWEHDLAKLLLQKERQREMVLQMRGAGVYEISASLQNDPTAKRMPYAIRDRSWSLLSAPTTVYANGRDDDVMSEVTRNSHQSFDYSHDNNRYSYSGSIHSAPAGAIAQMNRMTEAMSSANLYDGPWSVPNNNTRLSLDTISDGLSSGLPSEERSHSRSAMNSGSLWKDPFPGVAANWSPSKSEAILPAPPMDSPNTLNWSSKSDSALYHHAQHATRMNLPERSTATLQDSPRRRQLQPRAPPQQQQQQHPHEQQLSPTMAAPTIMSDEDDVWTDLQGHLPSQLLDDLNNQDIPAAVLRTNKQPSATWFQRRFTTTTKPVELGSNSRSSNSAM